MNVLYLIPVIAIIVCAMISLRITPRAMVRIARKSDERTLADLADEIAQRAKKNPSYTPFN